jgi:hypothetical protein
MKCPYCNKNVVGERCVVILAGEGPAHSRCHEQYLLSKRTFNNIDFSSMGLQDLNEMKEMLLIELNARDRETVVDNTDDIELFG